jgi:hypothetical protein
LQDDETLSPVKQKPSKPEAPLVMNVFFTQYDVVHDIAKECNL